MNEARKYRNNIKKYLERGEDMEDVLK